MVDLGRNYRRVVTVTQPTTGGTLAVDHASTLKWTPVYVTATPDAGVQMKLGSLRVNGKAVGGHSFLLLEDTTITAAAESVVVHVDLMPNPGYRLKLGTVELVRREGNNETVVAAGIGEYRFGQNSATAGTVTANDQNFEEETCTIYRFTFLAGTLNLPPEQRAKTEFLCIVNNKEVKLPVISFTDQRLELDTTQIPDQAMLIIEAFLPGSTDADTTTQAQHLQFNRPLRVYRQPEETKLPTIAPIVPAVGATEFAVTYEGGLYPTADVTVNIYQRFNDKLQSALKNKNIGRKDVILTSEQLGLSVENYLLYFSMGDKVISAQKVKLDKLKYTVTFYDWDGKQLGESQLVTLGADATAPANPIRDGYTFAGWYPTIAGETPWDFSTDKVTANLVLYAHWQAVSYSIGIDAVVPNGAIQCTNTEVSPAKP